MMRGPQGPLTYRNVMYCKICDRPIGREDSPNSTQCAGCERFVCESCENLLSDALTEINGAFYCAACADKPAIADLRTYLRTGEHKAVSRDGKEARWFGVKRCTADDGAILGWLFSGGGRVAICREPLQVEAAIRSLF